MGARLSQLQKRFEVSCNYEDVTQTVSDVT